MLERCNEAFIDILASMYLGPAYIVALLGYFLKTHPASDEDHVETWSRVKILSKLATQMSYDTLSRVLNAGDFDNVLETLKRHTTPDQQDLAQSDFLYLEKLLQSGLVGYVSDFFEQKDVKIYNVFNKYWTEKEVNSAVDKIDLDMLLFCLGENIPMAVRPSILLNTVIDYEKELVNLHPKTVTGSIKKWYVSHYYRKSK